MDVLRCNLKIEFFLRFQFLALSVLPPVGLVLLTLWGLWLQYNTGIFKQISGLFLYYFHPILKLVLSLIASDCFSIYGLFPGLW